MKGLRPFNLPLIKEMYGNGLHTVVEYARHDAKEKRGNVMQNVNKKYDTVMRILTGIPVFVYFLFFTGRTYSEAYLRTIGIPVGLVDYSFLDYAYFGAHIENLLITLVFTGIFGGLIWYIMKPASDGYTYKKIDLGFSLFYLIYSAVALSVMTLVLIFNPHLIVHPAMIVGIIVMSVMSVGLAILLFTDKGLIQRIKRGKYLSRLFVFAVVLILICFPYMLTGAWGAFKAFSFPYRDLNLSSKTLIEITVDYIPIEEISWEIKDDSSYVNIDRLYLILVNEGHLFIKSDLKELDTYVLRTDEVKSYKVIQVD